MNESSVAVRYLYTPNHGGASASQDAEKRDALVYRRCAKELATTRSDVWRVLSASSLSYICMQRSSRGY